MYVPDCEADDVIGYISKYSFPNEKKMILSSDKDFYQLLGEKVEIYSPTKKMRITHSDIVDEYNISPENFCLAKSICGDSSDNISGIKGAGFKTIAKRFPLMKGEESVMLSEILKICQERHVDKRSPKIYSDLIENKDIIKRNWRLIYLDTSNLSHNQIKRIGDTIDTFEPSRDKISVMRTLIREGIKTLDIDRFFLSFNAIRDTR